MFNKEENRTGTTSKKNHKFQSQIIHKNVLVADLELHFETEKFRFPVCKDKTSHFQTQLADPDIIDDIRDKIARMILHYSAKTNTLITEYSFNQNHAEKALIALLFEDITFSIVSKLKEFSSKHDHS